MTIVERDVTYLVLPPSLAALKPGDELSSFELVSGPKTHFPGVSWKLEFPLPQAYRVLLTGPDRPRPPHDNLRAPATFCSFKLLSLDTDKCQAVFAFPAPQSGAVRGGDTLELQLQWPYQVFATVFQVRADGSRAVVVRDLQARPYGFTEHGVLRHWGYDRKRLHLGLGEKAAPLDLSGRKFAMAATDAAYYDTYRTDPLYKHTPFLISTPRATAETQQQGTPLGLTYAIAHGTNSMATWDIGGQIDYPSGGLSKRYVQDWGGLEEWTLIGTGVEGVVKTYAELAGKPRLVGRDWLGYLGSTMLLADKENAQELLEQWPRECAEHDVPCSAMHLSSGFTADERTGSRWVFYMNKKRYPDFKAMVKVYHEAGMKVVPNVKPYILQNHPAYQSLVQADGLFYDPVSKTHSKQNLWSTGEGEYGDGSWVDFSAPGTRAWWAQGCQGLFDLGVDGMWDDNNEFYTRDDSLVCRNDFDFHREVEVEGAVNNGLLGRITGNEIMNKTSHDVLEKNAPERRTFVLTRSGNPAAFRYACSTWSGDNEGSWHNMRGSQHIQLNSSLSLMQSTGADVGGFGGEIPGPELIARWVQLGVTHARFCIHSAPYDPHGRQKLNTPWMHPEVFPAIRDQIKWRYRVLPFLNNLMWRSHLHADPTNAPLFYGPFAGDPELYTERVLEGFDAWMGVGQILTAPQLFEGGLTRDVYLPKAAADDTSVYFDLHAPYAVHAAGQWITLATPIEHGGLLAREGAVIPVGKTKATVTALTGPARTHTDGVDVVLESEGGQVGLDDWRGVLLFPGPSSSSSSSSSAADLLVYQDFWIEDDGISAEPGTFVVELSYTATADAVTVHVTTTNKGFTPLWQGKLHVILPVGDTRKVVNGTKTVYEDRHAWAVDV